MSFQTVEDMQDRLRNMCDEIDFLKYELEKAASDERAKIVAWLRETIFNCRVPEDIPALIEAGEHLK